MTGSIMAFVVTCILIELTPGPNMAYLAVLSASEGRRAGFAATLGVALGLLIVGLAAAFGLTALINSQPWAYEVMRWGGIGYLLYLAWEGWRGAEEASSESIGAPEGVRTFFMRGLITNLLNPKAAVFYLAVLPPFIDAARGVLAQSIWLSLIYVAAATAIHSTIVVLAGSARPYLEDRVLSRWVRRALSVALALIAVWFAVATRR